MAGVATNGSTAGVMKATGLRITWMARGCTPGRMEDVMKAAT